MAAAEDDLEVLLLHLERSAFGGGAHRGGPRGTFWISAISPTTSPRPPTRMIRPRSPSAVFCEMTIVPVGDDIEHIFIRTLLAQHVVRRVGVEFGQRGHFRQLLVVQPFEGQAQQKILSSLCRIFIVSEYKQDPAG